MAGETINYDARLKSLSMLVVMGSSGAGKSHFVNTLAGHQVTAEGRGLQSCTPKCVPALVRLGNRPVLVIDTPGFDDTRRPDRDILEEIARILALTHRLGVPLAEIVYLHSLKGKGERFGGAAVEALEILKRVCGEGALCNVMLATSKWSEIGEDNGSYQEAELRKTFWPHLLANGSSMCRFYGSRESAVALVSQLLVRDPITLDLQKELVEARRLLWDTTAGCYVHANDQARRRVSEVTDKSPSPHSFTSGMAASSPERQMRSNAVGVSRQQQKGPHGPKDEEGVLGRLIVDEVDEVTRTQQVWAKIAAALPHISTAAGVLVDIIVLLVGA